MSTTDLEVPSGPELSDYVALLRRRWLSIAVVLVVVLAAAAAWSFSRVPVYEGATEVLLQPIREDPFDGNARVDQLVSPDTEVRVVLSGAVADRVADAVDTDRTPQGLLRRTTVSVPRGTLVLRIVHADEDPEQAVAVARAFASQYLAFRAEQAAATVQEQLEALTSELERLNGELDGVVDVLALAEVDEDEDGVPDVPGNELAAAEARQRVLTERIASAESEVADKEAFTIVAGEVIDRGVVPDDPASPDHVRNLAAGGIVGLLLGLFAAFAVDSIDPRITRAGEVEQLTGVAVLTTVPAGRRRKGVTGPQRDAYRRLALVLRNASVTRDVLLVASATELRERPATTVRLAEALSRMGSNVLVVDADLRSPGVHEVLGLPNDRGLADVLADGTRLQDVVVHPEGNPSLAVLTAGRIGDDRVTALEEHPLQTLLAHARGIGMDVVVIDAPAIDDAADALSLQGAAEGVLLVAKERTTTRNGLEELQVQFDTVGAKMIGAVLHRARRRR